MPCWCIHTLLVLLLLLREQLGGRPAASSYQVGHGLRSSSFGPAQPHIAAPFSPWWSAFFFCWGIPMQPAGQSTFHKARIWLKARDSLGRPGSGSHCQGQREEQGPMTKARQTSRRGHQSTVTKRHFRCYVGLSIGMVLLRS